MLRDITLGQYYPGNSPVHKLDPRVKLFGALVYIVSLFVFRGILGFLLATVFLIFVIKICQVPFRFMVKGLKAIVILMAFTAVFNLFLTPGEHVLFHYGIFTITMEGVKNAAFMLIRLTYLIVGTSVMTLTTTPNQLTDGLEKALKPLSKIGVPVHAVSMMMSIALRFIPILIEETDIIMKAQMARGANFEEGSLIALFISAFRRADDLAMAMEARCYEGGEGRTKMRPLKYQGLDYGAYVLLLAYLGGIIFLRFFIV